MNELIEQQRELLARELDGRAQLPDIGETEYSPIVPVSPSKLAALIDHTLLRPEAKPDEVAELCREAREYGFATACVNSRFVPLARELLRGAGPGIAAVIGFPFGASSTEAKVCEAHQALRDGATELDMVLPVGPLRAGDHLAVLEDVRAVREAAPNAVLKVILETCLLTDEEKVRGALLAVAAGADFVKTSTGFGSGGATVEDVRLLRATVGDSAGVKASGGIRTWEDARAMLEAGASRLGCSRSVAILEDFERGGM